MSTNKTRAERITAKRKQITEMENDVKRLVNEEKEFQRKARTRRLCKRAGLLESLLPDTITLSDDRFETSTISAYCKCQRHRGQRAELNNRRGAGLTACAPTLIFNECALIYHNGYAIVVCARTCCNYWLSPVLQRLYCRLRFCPVGQKLKLHRKVVPQLAIYHLSIKVFSRGKGRSAVAAAAYRSADIIKNEYDGRIHDYTRKGGVAHTEIMLPANTPDEYMNRSTLKGQKFLQGCVARRICYVYTPKHCAQYAGWYNRCET